MTTPSASAATDGSPVPDAAGDESAHDAGAAGDKGTKGERRRPPSQVHGINGDNIASFDPPHTSSLTGEMWTVIIHRDGAPPDTEIVELECDRAYITFYNLVLLKSRLGYSGRDFLYYKERCGNHTASLILVDYENQTTAMLAANERERKLRIVMTTVQQTQLEVSITPMKRPRDRTTEKTVDVPTAEEPIDGYKEWFVNLQQDQPDTEFRDDYRDETIKTYKEWLRRQEFLPDILSYLDDDDSDDDNLPDDGRLASNPSPQKELPSHARRKKRKGHGSNEGPNKGGRGAAKGLAAAIKRIKTGSQKLKIDFSSRLGGPIGPNARSFVDEVVMFTRKRAPLIGVRKWKDIELNVKNSIALDIMNRWDLQNTDDQKEKIWAIAKERYKGWRSTLSATYKAYDSYDARMKHKPEDLDIIEWHYLILYFGSDDFKKVSNRNSINREKKRTNHCMGSKPFSQLSDEQRDPETGEEPGDLSLWMCTHMKNGQWSDEASRAVYDDALFKVVERQCSIDPAFVSTDEENNIFQSSYKQSTGCKTSTVHGHGYLSKRPTMRESMQHQLQEQARATDAANQKNIELQEEVVRLNEKLANQEAESERRLEEKLQQFKEEESNKLQALREEFMAALAGSRGTPLVQTATKSIDPSEATPTVEESVADIPTSNACETRTVQTTPKSIDPSEATPTVQKTTRKTPASKATQSVSQNNKNYTSTHQLMNVAIKRVRTRSQQDI